MDESEPDQRKYPPFQFHGMEATQNQKILKHPFFSLKECREKRLRRTTAVLLSVSISFLVLVMPWAIVQVSLFCVANW